jgi:hypothetical protein
MHGHRAVSTLSPLLFWADTATTQVAMVCAPAMDRLSAIATTERHRECMVTSTVFDPVKRFAAKASPKVSYFRLSNHDTQPAGDSKRLLLSVSTVEKQL